MRSREQITGDMIRAAQPSESDKHLLRLLKAELLNVELLMDIRDLLQALQPPTYTIAQPEVRIDDEGLHRKD